MIETFANKTFIADCWLRHKQCVEYAAKIYPARIRVKSSVGQIISYKEEITSLSLNTYHGANCEVVRIHYNESFKQ